MKAFVTRLRSAGVRLSKAELDASEAVEGDLVLEDWPQGGGFKRPVRVARLHPPVPGFYPQLLPPLFDAQVLRIETSRLFLSGIEIHAEGDVTREVAQTWVALIG